MNIPLVPGKGTERLAEDAGKTKEYGTGSEEERAAIEENARAVSKKLDLR